MSELSRFIYYYTDPDGGRNQKEHYEYYTESGPVASFETNVDAPLRGLEVGIKLVQSGSGNPSPENIRPITGWTGLTLFHSGADTSDPEELAVSWEDEAGTVYAGTLDVVSGVLTVLYYDVLEDARGMTVTGNTPNNTVQARFKPTLQAFSGLSSDIVSDRFSSANGSGQPGMIARVNLGDGAWIYLNIPQSELAGTTTEDVQAWVAEAKPVILLLLTAPLTYQLPPRTVRTLMGKNNIWADAGDVEVTYPVKV